MLQSEFEARVQMKVSEAEYWHINEVYNQSDLDKDEFCKLWIKMNQARVNKAREIAKAVEADLKVRDKLWEIVYRFGGMNYTESCKLAADFFNKTQQKLIESVGIKIERSEVYFQTVSDVIWEVKKYLGRTTDTTRQGRSFLPVV